MGGAFFLAVSWAAIGLLIAIPTMKVFHLWLYDKAWSAGAAAIAFFTIFAGLGVVWTSINMLGAIFYALLLILATVLMPIFEDRGEKRALQEMRDEDIRRYQKTIRFDPHNAAAHAFLAEAYAERSQLDEAIAELETAVSLEQHQADSERYRYRLKRLRAERDGAAHKPIRVCEHCRCETPLENRVCRKCGKPLQVGFFAWLIKPENWKSILKQGGIAVGLVILIGLLLTPLSVEVKGCVFISALAVGAFLLLRRMGE